MKRFYLDQNLKIDNEYILEDELFNQIVNVLRMTSADRIILFNGSKIDYVCEIVEIFKKKLIVKVLEECVNTRNPKVNVTLFQALVKGEKLELITQKITEIGVSNLVPFQSTFCDVKTNTAKINRLPKITIEACKQCGRSVPINISNVVSFDEMIEELKTFDKVIFAYERAVNPLEVQPINSKNIAIIVGSEGGFSDEEAVKISELKNAQTISLGKRILRAETAAITLTSTVMFLSDIERN